MFSPNAKLYEGSLKNLKPSNGSYMGALTGVRFQSGTTENIATFTAKYPQGFEEAKVMFEYLRKSLNTEVNVWVVDGDAETKYQGELIKVETHSDSSQNRIIDKFEITIVAPHS